MHLLTAQAISAALAQQWDTAITLNQKILQQDPTDYDALNRLAYAFFELGRIDEAIEMFERVLSLDPKNLIATRNLSKMHQLIKQNSQAEVTHHDEVRINPQMFLEEPGKTRTTNLIRIAAKDILAGLRVGFTLDLMPKNRTIAVLYGDHTCIGYLPDDLAFSLGKFMSGGNEYTAYVKSVSPNLVSIFIKEVKQSPTFQNIPSFIDPKKKSSHVYRTMHSEPPSTMAQENSFDYQDEMEKDAFEVE